MNVAPLGCRFDMLDAGCARGLSIVATGLSTKKEPPRAAARGYPLESVRRFAPLARFC
jgi:hypothetical protein